MSVAFLVSLLILGGFGVLLYRRLVSAPGYTSPWVRFGVIAALLLLTGAMVVGFGYQSGGLDGPLARGVGAVGMTWLATAFYLLLGVGLGALGALVLRIARRGPQARRTWHRRTVPAIVAGAVALTGYGVFEARQIGVTEAGVTVPDLPPEFEGYRVALIADLHVGPLRGAGLTERVVALTNDAEPDVVLLAGDLTDGTTAAFGSVLDPLGDLVAPDGVYAATGNHEYYAGDAAGWVARWQQLGVTPLLNTSEQLVREPGTLRIAGVSDRTGADGTLATEPGLEPDLAAALAQATADETTILISHQPGSADDPLVRSAGVDLIVSGHTHGGQIWPFTLLVRLANPTVAGLDEVGGTTAYTTRGAGTWGPPTRVLVPPEVAVLTLTAG